MKKNTSIMITTLKKYEDHRFDNQTETYHAISEYLGTFERKMVIFESNWDTEDIFNSISVYPFLSNIPNILGNKFPVQVGLRHLESFSIKSNRFTPLLKPRSTEPNWIKPDTL
jgi:uncharacterized protein YozE (UPF0346 family)